MPSNNGASLLGRFLFAATFALALIANGTYAVSQDNLTPLPGAHRPNGYPWGVNGFHVVDFRTENLIAPEGVDVPNPRFSWKLFSQTINETQSAYRITVTKPFDGEAVVWDSGKVESDRQHYVKYEGEALEPATEYMVELNVWNKDGSQKSQIYAPFSTGLFPTDSDPNPWKGQWIGLNSRIEKPEPADISKGSWIAFEKSMQLPIGASVYRKTFEVKDVASVKRAVANISADNRGVVYLNGVDIGGSDEYQRAATRDMTALIREGKNVFAVRADNVGGSPNPGGVLGAPTKLGKRSKDSTRPMWPLISTILVGKTRLVFANSATPLGTPLKPLLWRFLLRLDICPKSIR